MSNTTERGSFSEIQGIEFVVKLLVVLILLAACVAIILPFIVPVLWGGILAITLFPLFERLVKLLRGRIVPASVLMVGILLLLLICPSVWLVSSMIGGSGAFIESLRNHTLAIPFPKPEVAAWPLIGKPVYDLWHLVSTNMEAALMQYREQVITIGEAFLGAIKNIISGFLMMLLSIIISGILLVSAEKSHKSTMSLARRIFSDGGEEYVSMIVLTVRNVAKGILGVAFIQFVLLGATFILAGIPFAGLWALAALLLAITQLPVGLVAIPMVIYLYGSRDPLSATLWTLLIILFSLSDNILKPWLMGKGAPVPMIVIFLGAIGGMIMSGFIGLFTGAIILSLGYKMVTIWMAGKGTNEKSC